jgi:ADP-ribose pyrophosphatase YjhB (NUDIX family)
MECPKCGHPIRIYKNPLPTVDIIIEVADGIILIERKNKPLGWALPGGFVDYGESLEQAAVREALEETGLSVKLTHQLKTYSDPDRDPRHHTISTVYIASADGLPRAGDDAARAGVFTRYNLPPLVFDHAKILADYFTFKNEALSP